jgi:phosphoribosylformylglycinamidine synthase subunit PurS
MTTWLARIQVSLKPVVNDPEGLSIAKALHQLEFGTVRSVRAGRFFEITLDADSKELAAEQIEAMCRRLLANPVIEEYRFTVARRRSARAVRRRYA